MAKTNFTKVEEALTEGLRQMTISKLLKETEESSTPKQKQAKDALSLLVASLRHEFGWFAKKDPYFIPKLKVEKERIKQLFKQREPYTQEQIAELKDLKTKIEAYKQSVAAEDSSSENERIVETELKRQKTKRFNIRDKWLPLH
ncbi:hypothetical protein [Parachlamydia sp. AcF125]|uniref:hypothetical protein n=1 Tax=Parachlamydia sp. AcF125 TaxID=2795736 RepID=UPI001BC9E3B7|nr:hypothetical protein [Parachlamydia sp. AcF125]MBS4168765.1 hypothetical protein [Parachlamydia sp. AcF125]